MNSPKVFRTLLQKDTDTRQFALNVMLLQCGLYMIVGLFTVIMLQFVVSGDSSTQRQEPIQRLLTPPSAEIQ